MKDTTIKRIVPITELRRNFGKVTSRLLEVEELILTKGGEPFATLKIVPEKKKKMLATLAGVWKGTSLDNDDLWNKTVKKKSRRTPISL